MLAHGIAQFDRCIYVDADTRMYDRPPAEWLPLEAVGFAARVKQSLPEKYDAEKREPQSRLALNTLERRWSLIRRSAELLGVDYRMASFVPEQLFSLTRAGGVEQVFLDDWERAAVYQEVRGFSWGEGYTMGLATVSSGIAYRDMGDVDHWLFKDVIVIRRSDLPEPQARAVRTLIEEREKVGQQYRKQGLARKWQKFRRRTAEASRYVRLLGAVATKRRPALSAPNRRS